MSTRVARVCDDCGEFDWKSSPKWTAAQMRERHAQLGWTRDKWGIDRCPECSRVRA